MRRAATGRCGNQKLSVAALARAGEAEPDSRESYALLGDVYRRRGMFDEAGRIFEVLAISPDRSGRSLGRWIEARNPSLRPTAKARQATGQPLGKALARKPGPG